MGYAGTLSRLKVNFRFRLSGKERDGDAAMAVTTRIDDPVLVRFRKALGEIYGNQIDRVVLFGSRARGDARPDSDYDVAVFLKSLPDRAARRRSWIVWLSSGST